MAARSHPARPPSAPRRRAGPGRPKDPAKRVAILEASTRMFLEHGHAASMEQIAAAAGVSKLTVYSHFGSKDALFTATVQAYCERQLPASLFAEAADIPLPRRLLEIARAFHALSTGAEAIAAHRMLCAPQVAGSELARLFWEAGPQRVHDEFARLLRKRIDAGDLVIDADADPHAVERASAQFFALLKGDLHARAVFGCAAPRADDPDELETHLAGAVTVFLRAYARPAGPPADAAPIARQPGAR